MAPFAAACYFPDMNKPQPTFITLHEKSRVLEVAFADGACFRIPFELLRVYSPSAEVQGHEPGQAVLQTGKRHVTIERLEAVGHYAVRPTFSDGHNSGLFTWEILYRLGHDHQELWADYARRLAVTGCNRDDAMPAKRPKTCGKP